VRLNAVVRGALILAGVVTVVAGSMMRADAVGWVSYAIIAFGSVAMILGFCGSIPVNRNRRHGERVRPEDLHDELRARFGQ
jgi:hypothetical protein